MAVWDTDRSSATHAEWGRSGHELVHCVILAERIREEHLYYRSSVCAKQIRKSSATNDVWHHDEYAARMLWEMRSYKVKCPNRQMS